jgi:cytochrome P450
MATSSLPPLDFNSPNLKEDSYSIYRQYREAQPIFWSEDLGAWVFFRFDHIQHLLNDPRSSANRAQSYLHRSPASRQSVIAPIIDVISRWVLFLDGGDHTRLRKLINHGFTHQVVDRLQPVIESVAVGLLEPLEGQAQFDASTDFAYLLPVRVISDMLCVAPED